MQNHNLTLYSYLRFTMMLLTMSILTSETQASRLRYDLQYQSVGSDGIFAPFWLQSKHYGSVSQAPFSTNLRSGIFKDIDGSDRLFDYGFGIDAILQTSPLQPSEAWLQQFYAEARFWIFDLRIGTKEEYHGVHNPRLSAGGYIMSENARPMPKITAGIEQFTSVPYTANLIDFKGAVTQGWFSDEVWAPDIYLHHKYLHLKLGGKWPVRLQLGLDHVAQWGGKIPGNGDQSLNFQNFKTIFFGKSGGEDSNVSEQINALGNHIIAEHIRLEATINNYDVHLYWLTVAEDGPIRILPWQAMNRKDGLWGLSVTSDKCPFFRGFVYEFFNTLDQSGPWHDKDGIVYGGMDSYFTNGIYRNGWTHFGRTIGTPLILSPVFNTNGSYQIKHNTLQAHHFGFEGGWSEYSVRTLATFSRYYINNQTEIIPNQSWMFEITRNFGTSSLSLSLGADTGELPGKTAGAMMTFRRIGILSRP